MPVQGHPGRPPNVSFSVSDISNIKTKEKIARMKYEDNETFEEFYNNMIKELEHEFARLGDQK